MIGKAKHEKAQRGKIVLVFRFFYVRYRSPKKIDLRVFIMSKGTHKYGYN